MDNGASMGTTVAPEQEFLELRRKVKQAEILSAATVKLLLGVRFTGKLSVIVQNGRILKSGYEEGYFHQSGP